MALQIIETSTSIKLLNFVIKFHKLSAKLPQLKYSKYDHTISNDLYQNTGSSFYLVIELNTLFIRK